MKKQLSIDVNEDSLIIPKLKKSFDNNDYLSYLIYLDILYNKSKEFSNILNTNKKIIRDRLVKTSNILVSVIIPIFNSEKYLKNTITSIIQQTLYNIEIILVNDASTDKSLEIINKFQNYDDRIIVINLNNNKGAGFARNIGLSIAKGQYIIFLDSDDKFYSNMLEHAYNFAYSKNADVIFWKYAINDNGKIYHNIGIPHTVEKNKNFSNLNIEFSKITNPVPWNKLFRNDFIYKNKLCFQKLRTCNDLGFVWSSLATSESTYYLDEELIEYKKDNKGSLSLIRSKKLINVIQACKYVIQHIKTNNIKYPIEYIYKSIISNFKYEIDRCTSVIDKNQFINEVYKFLPSSYHEIFNSTLYKISVIIPVYNCKDYLIQCFESIQNQTFKDIEIIFIDDESTDGSLELLYKFQSLDNRVVIIKNKHSGPGASRNEGIKIARGQYLFFVDSDDWLDQTCLEKLYKKSILSNSDICLFGLKKFDEKNQEYISDTYYDLSCYKRYIDINKYIYSFKDIKNCIFRRFSAFLKLYSKKFILNNNLSFPENTLGEDVIVHIKSLLLANKISFIDECLYYYRFNRSASIMNSYTKNEKAIYDVIYFLRQTKNFLYSTNNYEFLQNEYLNFTIGQFKYYLNKLQYTNNIKKLKEEFFYFFYELKIFDKEIYSTSSLNNFLKKDDFVLNFKPDVTIIISAFNAEKTIHRCVNSLLSQTHHNIEVICVDDGSEDQTKSIIETYEKNDFRFHGIYKKNSGQANSRNIALKEARGKYIEFVDADDWIETDTIEKLFYISESLSLEMLSFSGYNIINEEKSINNYWEYNCIDKKYLNKILPIDEKNRISYLLPVSSCLTFYNKKFLQDNNIFFPDGLIFEDNVFFTKSILRCKKFAVTKMYLYNRLCHKNQTTQQCLTSQKIFDIFKIFDICINEYKTFLNNYEANKYLNIKFKNLLYRYKDVSTHLKEKYELNLYNFINKYFIEIPYNKFCNNDKILIDRIVKKYSTKE